MITVGGLEKLGVLRTNVQHIDIRKEGQVAVAKAAYLVERGSKRAITSGPTRAIRTGALRASISVKELTAMKARIGPVMHYGIYVHEGTRFMRARPFMTAGVALEAKSIDNALKDTGLHIAKQVVRGL